MDKHTSALKKGFLLMKELHGESSPKPKGYHNQYHAMMVADAVDQLANHYLRLEKISGDKIKLLKIAAAWHDIVQGYGSPSSEEKSVEFMKENLLELELDTSEIEFISASILSTSYILADNKLVQNVTGEDMYSKIIADADLRVWADDDFLVFFKGLCEELSIKPYNSLSPEEIKKALESQIKIMSNHDWHTDYAHILWDKKKRENINILKDMLHDLS